MKTWRCVEFCTILGPAHAFCVSVQVECLHMLLSSVQQCCTRTMLSACFEGRVHERIQYKSTRTHTRCVSPSPCAHFPLKLPECRGKLKILQKFIVCLPTMLGKGFSIVLSTHGNQHGAADQSLSSCCTSQQRYCG